MVREIIPTADGSQTLFLPEMDESYHSVNGAITESEYVFIEKGYCFHPNPEPTVFEVGFGTGLNALLTAVEANKNNRKTIFYTIEKFPLEDTLIRQLNYGKLISKKAQELFEKIHSCKWNELVEISPFFLLYKIHTDIITSPLSNIEKCDVIYFDAFGPDKQPEMWTPVIFKKIFDLCLPESVFVTYSAKGEVRRQLTAVGFQMERLQGPPGKKQMLRGIKKNSIL
ncbi:MAG TPA: tRNA (5-methylaminomethyl-2-thiouridine)(34)-methyltransferase MnmD [Draconibacterium sp.]|nr:tRNA (5-methylaminomethyl-2-thiouridine)(34)-methyltransferase MnmD [Draconibacterium sp.]